MSIPARDLREGMQTPSGLVIESLRKAHGYVNVEFSGYSCGKAVREVFYAAEQMIEIADHTTESETEDMAQRVNILVESDLSGEPEASTVTFGLDGTTYEIDLTVKEQEKMRKAFAPYIGAARPVKSAARKRGTATSGPAPADIRAWAKEKTNLDVPDRGRIPEAVREAYNQAH